MYSTGEQPETIVCLADLDCFFVEVERLHRPELRGKAVAIGGPPDKRGVVSACSYEARALGIHSAMPMAQAYRKAKVARAEVAFLHENLHGNYSLYSRRIRDILEGEVPYFRAKSIDEFELDITGCTRLLDGQHGGVVPFIEHLRERVRCEVGLPISVGVGPSAIIAKMASRHAKPNGVHRILPSEVDGFLAPHDIQAVPGIGPVTASGLRARGIERVGQLLALPERMLWNSFGAGLAGVLQALKHTGPRNLDGAEGMEGGAFGKGTSRRKPKTIGHETTFERDVVDPVEIMRTLWRLTEDACSRLREADLRTSHVTVKIRYSDFGTQTHGGFLYMPTDADSTVFRRIKELYYEGNTRPLRIRLLGVRLERLTVGASQLALFTGKREKREEQFFLTVDAIRERYGKKSVYVGPGVARIKHDLPGQGHATAGISFRPVGAGV